MKVEILFSEDVGDFAREGLGVASERMLLVLMN